VTRSQKHRGAHPQDAALFAEDQRLRLARAVSDLSWLLTGGYSEPSALKLVGDRYGLRKRQRAAVSRCACADADRTRRSERRLSLDQMARRPVAIDGFNALITLEAALGGGVVLIARDAVMRDLSSVHGSYKRVHETRAAATALGEVLERAQPATTTWYLDRPVSNSGRLKVLLAELAEERGWGWDIQLVDNPDRTIAASDAIAASGDSWVLDTSAQWVDIVSPAVAAVAPDAWVVDLSSA